MEGRDPWCVSADEAIAYLKEIGGLSEIRARTIRVQVFVAANSDTARS